MYTFEQKRQAVKHIYFGIQEKKFNLRTLKEILYLRKKTFIGMLMYPIHWIGGEGTPPPPRH